MNAAKTAATWKIAWLASVLHCASSGFASVFCARRVRRVAARTVEFRHSPNASARFAGLKSRQNHLSKLTKVTGPNATPPRRRGGFARLGERALLLGRRAERDARLHEWVETARRQVRLPLDAARGRECMARAMQLLLPGPSLRPAFAAAAIREAEHWWLGDLIHHHGHCYDGWWTLDGSRTVPPQPIPKRRRGPGPRRHPAGAPRKHRDPERARARARAVAAARPHHSKWSPRDVAAAIADEVGRNEQKA